MRPIDADVLKKDLTRFYISEVTARELIDEQPTIGWISVKDRKPPAIHEARFRKENDPVLLLAGKQRAVYVGWYIGEDYRGIDCYISRTSLNAYQHITRKITHWMPMPEPPKERDKNDATDRR